MKTYRYVLGFLFNATKDRAWLIIKKRPSWQAGRLNGIGGHIENGETPEAAMVREFREETGVLIPVWEHAVLLYCPRVEMFVFRSFVEANIFSRVKKTTDEQPQCLPITAIYSDRYLVIPNLRWLIPLILDVNLDVPIRIVDTSMPGESRRLLQ